MFSLSLSMNKMEKEFVPYEEALALKELGFNEPCFGYYYTTNGKDWQFAEKSEYYRLDDEINIGSKFSLLVPTFSQAFRWFREKYNFCYFIRGNNYDGYSYNIDNLGLLQYKFEIDYRFTFKTYEEAELACLIKLIQIIKNK